MTYLITKQNKKITIYIPAIYGYETWGDTYNQESMEKKRKSWYITSWQSSSEGSDDRVDNYKINVVYETTSLHEVIKYLYNAKVPKEEFDSLLDDVQKQINDFIAFEKWRYN